MGLGLWAAGGGWGDVQEQETLAVIDAALECGVNLFDTADVYGNGLSEILLGRAMKGRRSRFVVATKIGWIGFDGESGQSCYDRPEKVYAAAENCLRRLGTDYIDLLQSHIFFREQNTDVLLEGLNTLRERGVIRAYGISSGDFSFIQDVGSREHCASLQLDYSILNRIPESEMLPFCLERGIATIVRGPLAMGILTGKLTAASRFPEGDHRQAWIVEPEAHRIYMDDLARVDRLRALTSDKRSLAQLALQFVLNHPAVTTVIPGARSVAQLRENMGCLAAPPLAKDELEEIDRIVAPNAGRQIWPA